MKLVGSTKSNCGNVTRLEITEVVLIHSNILGNGYQQYSRVLYTFVPNKSFGQLLDISPMNFIFLKTFDSEFWYIEVWFTDQNSKPPEIEDKINITLVINKSVKYKSSWDIKDHKCRIFGKGYGFLYFTKYMGKNIGKNISKFWVVNMVRNFLIMFFKKSHSKNSRSNWWFNW